MEEPTIFYVREIPQTVSINPSEVSAKHDGFRSYLNVHLRFQFRSIPKAEFDFLSINARLKMNKVVLSEVNEHMGIKIQIDNKDFHNISFPLSTEILEYIENQRNGNIAFEVAIKGAGIIKSEYRVGDKNVFLLNEIHTFRNDIDVRFIISQSEWIVKILAQLKYKAFKLIEVPLSHKFLKEAYSEIVNEFDKAEIYFKQNDYNKCIAHCRNTMDALKRNLKKIKDNTESESNFEWLKKISTSTFAWIDSLNKGTSELASKTHHSGNKTNFTKYEAESIYLVVLGLMNYIGHENNK